MGFAELRQRWGDRRLDWDGFAIWRLVALRWTRDWLVNIFTSMGGQDLAWLDHGIAVPFQPSGGLSKLF
jgi:hypothetical protein